jgi:hypothetical protein
MESLAAMLHRFWDWTRGLDSQAVGYKVEGRENARRKRLPQVSFLFTSAYWTSAYIAFAQSMGSSKKGMCLPLNIS